MTIPQLENEIRILHERASKAESHNEALQQNINELRQQLGVDRTPSCDPISSYGPKTEWEPEMNKLTGGGSQLRR